MRLSIRRRPFYSESESEVSEISKMLSELKAIGAEKKIM